MSYNLVLRSTVLLCAATGAYLLKWPESVSESYQVAAKSFSFPLLIWAVTLLTFLFDGEILRYWRSDTFFSKTAIVCGAMTISSGLFWMQGCFDCRLLDQLHWVIPGTILMLGGVGLMAYLFDKRMDQAKGLISEKPEFLKVVLFWSFHLLGMLLFIVVMPRQYDNLLNPVWCYATLVPVSLVAALVYSTFARNLWLQHIREAEEQQKYQLVIGLLAFIILLTGLGYFNRHPLEPERRTKTVLLREKSGSGEKRAFSFELNGANRNFLPNQADWEAARAGDSLRLSIKSGALGFDFIEKFEPIRQ
ncbi:MAG: hypothetical protein R3D58_16015 [Saprospiraceae bacterium]|nr:hypothetical protein [Lewinellaceae bacterium]